MVVGGEGSTQEEAEALASLRGLSLTGDKGGGSDSDGDVDRALSALFVEGQALVAALEEGTEDGEARARSLEKALRLFVDLKAKVSALGLGRGGEEAEDLGTGDLKFVLVDYYLGRLQQEVDTSQGGPRGRKASLDISKRHYARFMAQCERLRLLRGEDLRAWEAETAQDAEAEGGGDGDHDQGSGQDDQADDDRRRRALLPTGGKGLDDPAVVRERKIERFRREKAGKERLKELNALYAKLVREAKGDEDALAEKEEVERERVLLWVGACIRKALDEWPLLRQELQILTMMLGREAQAGGGDPRTRGRDGDRDRGMPQAPAKPLSLTHIDAVGGRLRVRQEELRAQVFRPGYNLPTMSLEELAAKEVADAQAREERSKNAPKGPRRYAQLEADGEEDDEKLVEEAAYHDRAWDDWKDDHPRGMGNKAGKRF